MIDYLFVRTIGTGGSRIGIAYIYCDYWDQINQNIMNMIGSLTSQLLGFITDYRLHEICEEIKLEDKMKKKQGSLNIIICILKLVLKTFDHTFICPDAIDELETKTRSSFLKSIHEMMISRNISTMTWKMTLIRNS